LAFTPEDVLNKHFTATQFRRGYDEQEVDDFLDEIVIELRRLSSGNDDLGAQLKACQEGKGVSVATVGVASTAAGYGIRADSTVARNPKDGGPPVAAKDRDGARSGAATAVLATEAGQARQGGQASDKIAAAERSAEQAEEDAAARISKANTAADRAEAQAAERVKAAGADKNDKSGKNGKAPALTPGVAQADVSSAATGVLALAQKLHEEYVAEGQTTRERLINEGQAHHDKVVGEATAKQAEFLSTGRAKHDEFLSTGQARHAELLSTGQAKHDSLIAEASARHEQLITEARERSTSMVAEAEHKKAEVLHSLGSERADLQKKIDELRIFERDYRARLKTYLESQLQDLAGTGANKPAEVKTDEKKAGNSPAGQQHAVNDGHHG
jgi:DivIVA domain-containing protein